MTWQFYTPSGLIETNSVNRNIGSGKSSGSEKASLKVLLDPDETKLLEEQLGKIGSVTEREVADGTSFTEDANGPSGPKLGAFDLGEELMHGLAPSEIRIDPTAGAEDMLTPGIYAVKDWETKWRDSQKYEMMLDLGFVSSTKKVGFGTNFGRDFG